MTPLVQQHVNRIIICKQGTGDASPWFSSSLTSCRKIIPAQIAHLSCRLDYWQDHDQQSQNNSWYPITPIQSSPLWESLKLLNKVFIKVFENQTVLEEKLNSSWRNQQTLSQWDLSTYPRRKDRKNTSTKRSLTYWNAFQLGLLIQTFVHRLRNTWLSGASKPLSSHSLPMLQTK